MSDTPWPPVFTFDLDTTDGEGQRVVSMDFAGKVGTLLVAKYGANGLITIEQSYRVEPVNEYQRAVDRETHRARAAAYEQALAEFWSRLLYVPVPGLAAFAVDAVLDLHAPDTEARAWLTCGVCDADELDPGVWPCRTVEAIAEAFGIEVPQ